MLDITPEEREGLKKTFKSFGRDKTKKEIFYDLCFCLLAPQTTFKRNRKVIKELQEYDFYKWNLIGGFEVFAVELLLKPVRFYKNKTKYLLEMKKNFKTIYFNINCIDNNFGATYFNVREWLVKNVKGLGYKTASHFLRNLGSKDLAIIDTHIIKFLSNTLDTWDYKPTKSNYLYYEEIFSGIAKENNLSVAELDALIWQRYSKTKWEDFKY